MVQLCRLDTAAAPTTTAVTAVVAVDLCSATLLATSPEEADKGRSEPQNGREEGEGDDRLELAAGITTRSDVGPVPETTADVSTDEIDEQTKGNPPQNAHEDIDGPGEEVAGKGEEAKQGEKDGDTGHDFGVDLAAELPAAAVGLVQVLAVDAGDDGGEDELGGPKDHADDTFESHGDDL